MTVSAAESVIIAHGLYLPGWETFLLQRRLQASGFRTHLFRFRTVRDSLDTNVARLARFAEKVPGEKLHFVGYSLGGVVTVAMLNANDVSRDGRVVCIGSPLNGSCVGNALGASTLGRLIAGNSIGQLVNQGGVGPWTRERELGVIAGNVNFGFGRLTGALPSPSDGTVAVAETEIEGASDYLVVPYTHTALLFARTVADQAAAFLQTGRFAH